MASFKTQREREEDLLKEYGAAMQITTPEEFAKALAKEVENQRLLIPDWAGVNAREASTKYQERLAIVGQAGSLSEAINLAQQMSREKTPSFADKFMGEGRGFVPVPEISPDLVAKVLFGKASTPDDRLVASWFTYGIPQERDQQFQKAKLLAEASPDLYQIDEQDRAVYKLNEQTGKFTEVGGDGRILPADQDPRVREISPDGELGEFELPPPALSQIEALGYLGGLPDSFNLGMEANVIRQQEGELAYRRFAEQERLGQDPTQPWTVQYREPRYFEFDHVALFASWDDKAIVEVQSAMVAGGLLKPGKFAQGHWDPTTQQAMWTLMQEANTSTANGTTWDSVLSRHVQRRENMSAEDLAEEAGLTPYVPRTYTAPDYNSLTAAVRETFAARLGRQPQAHEMELLAAEMSKNFKQQYSAQEAGARSAYEQGNRAVLFGEEAQGVTVQDVDPYARLSEKFQTLFGGEQQRIEDVGLQKVNTRQVMNTLAGLESYVGR